MILFLAALLPALASSPADAEGAIKLPPPGVQYRFNEASATRSPWLDANGWRILRKPDARYYYDTPPKAAALAAAEAFVYGADAKVHTSGDGVDAFHQMIQFLGGVGGAELPAMANIGIIDDGSPETGELMNLLTRRNLLYRIVNSPDPHLDVNVRLGSKDYPKAEASDPSRLAHRIRDQITDDKRVLRIYGSEVVIGRVMGDKQRVRVHLLNYAARPVVGLRVRVLGAYPKAQASSFGNAGMKLLDVSVRDGATEFTVPEMNTYAIIDLSK
jgi:hypothetical protein